jgi:hypothetical protein
MAQSHEDFIKAYVLGIEIQEVRKARTNKEMGVAIQLATQLYIDHLDVYQDDIRMPEGVEQEYIQTIELAFYQDPESALKSLIQVKDVLLGVSTSQEENGRMIEGLLKPVNSLLTTVFITAIPIPNISVDTMAQACAVLLQELSDNPSQDGLMAGAVMAIDKANPVLEHAIKIIESPIPSFHKFDLTLAVLEATTNFSSDDKCPLNDFRRIHERAKEAFYQQLALREPNVLAQELVAYQTNKSFPALDEALSYVAINLRGKTAISEPKP